MNDLTTLITYYGVGYTVRHAPKDNLGVYEDVEIIGVRGVAVLANHPAQTDRRD